MCNEDATDIPPVVGIGAGCWHPEPDASRQWWFLAPMQHYFPVSVLVSLAALERNMAQDLDDDKGF